MRCYRVAPHVGDGGGSRANLGPASPSYSIEVSRVVYTAPASPSCDTSVLIPPCAVSASQAATAIHNPCQWPPPLRAARAQAAERGPPERATGALWCACSTRSLGHMHRVLYAGRVH